MSSPVRVRFAPSPTGIMHIGNLRAALLNYLFAHQKHGVFILRIEDTDPARNFDPGAQQIIADLQWMSLFYNEGPGIGGPYAPYFQSERTSIYQEKLDALKKKKAVYPCFCTPEELDKKRARQVALKMPPRYDRECLKLSEQKITEYCDQNMPFVWRFKMDHTQVITIHDLAHGAVTFDFKNFSDFPITRSDGSFTFMFSNFVDDMTMKITHVFRGEDHLSNTAGQAAMYLAFDAPIPLFYHMPILCNVDGKKLSKRDFGFSLHDLKKAGFLPEAINNYLAIIGGSYAHEIMDLKELSQTIHFEQITASGQIKYDVEKLRWINHHWIQKLSPDELTERILPFLIQAYPLAKKTNLTQLTRVLQLIKTDFYVLTDAVKELKFYFEKPTITQASLMGCIAPASPEAVRSIIENHLEKIEDADAFVEAIKKDAKSKNVTIKQLFSFVRLALMGEVHGPSIHDLITILGSEESKKRIEAAVRLINT